LRNFGRTFDSVTPTNITADRYTSRNSSFRWM
jgi:hypothetical protein